MVASDYKRCKFELVYDSHVEIVDGYYNAADGLGLYKKGLFAPITPVGLPKETRIYNFNTAKNPKTAPKTSKPYL